MFGQDKNLKDGSTDLDITIKDSYLSISYTKTHKLVTALYMVTDVIDKEEPIRSKLRHLGAGIISDMHCIPGEACNKIAETVSFLNIASAMNLISEMNCNILKKEFLDLDGSIKDYTKAKPTWLEDFFARPPLSNGHLPLRRGRENPKGHTRIGVQKGSTLMKALSDKTIGLDVRDNFNRIKQDRRNNIIQSIKDNGGNATITDIKNKATGHLISCGEKTLQRELVSMVKDGVLNKTGEKRWSRYFLK